MLLAAALLRMCGLRPRVDVDRPRRDDSRTRLDSPGGRASHAPVALCVSNSVLTRASVREKCVGPPDAG